MRKLTPFDRSAQTAPVLLTAHAIHTADVAASTATAMLTDRGRILAIGTLADCEAAAERGGLSPSASTSATGSWSPASSTPTRIRSCSGR